MIETLAFPKLSQVTGLAHALTTRGGGTSVGRFTSLNLAFHVGDDPQAVRRNRELVASGFGIALEDLIVPQQTHSPHAAIVTATERGRGAYNHDTAIPNVDALITTDKNVCLMVLVADCSPVLVFDPKMRALAAIHAGRAGSLGRIISHTIRTMQANLGVKPLDLRVAIGPSIDGSHYPISAEKADALFAVVGPRSASLQRARDGYYFDLQTAHQEELFSLGVSSDRIERFDASTYSNGEAFFSERREGAPTGRFALLAKLCD